MFATDCQMNPVACPGSGTVAMVDIPGASRMVIPPVVAGCSSVAGSGPVATQACSSVPVPDTPMGPSGAAWSTWELTCSRVPAFSETTVPWSGTVARITSTEVSPDPDAKAIWGVTSSLLALMAFVPASATARPLGPRKTRTPDPCGARIWATLDRPEEMVAATIGGARSPLTARKMLRS